MKMKSIIIRYSKWLAAIASLLLWSLSASAQIRTDGKINRMQKWPPDSRNVNIDLSTYGPTKKTGNGRRAKYVRCDCDMCDVIYVWKAEYQAQLKGTVRTVRRTTPAEVKAAAQAPSLPSHMDTGIRIADIMPDTITGEFGCGIAEWSIRAVEAGAARAYGWEIDLEMVKKARLHVAAAVIAGRIPAGSVIIQHRDVRDVDPTDYGVTIGLCYLYDTLLDELQVAGKFTTLDKVVSPRHPIAGLEMKDHDGVWLWTHDPKDQPYKRLFHEFTPAVVESEPVLTPKVNAEQLSTKAEDIVLLYYHFSGCPGCVRWSSQQKNKMEYEIVDRGVAEGRVNGVTYYPAFQVAAREANGDLRILKKDNGKRYHWGYSSASALNHQLGRIEKDLNTGP